MSVSAGLLADRVLGEPPDDLHPVALFGTAMQAAERRLYRDSRAAGVLHTAIGVGLGIAAGRAVRSRAAATYVAVAGRMLTSTATRIAAALERDDVDGARALLPSLVGRDPESLDDKGIARATIESVAENTVDAIVAPALWAAVAGAPGVLAHRAVNTMDAMVGHRSPRYARYGWASARLDDAMAYVPARATAGLVAVVRPSHAGEVWRAVRRDAPAHPSPNSGVAEAAFAAALDLHLGGPTTYAGVTELRPTLGTGRIPDPADIHRAIRLTNDVTLALAGMLALVPNPRRVVDGSVHTASRVRKR